MNYYEFITPSDTITFKTDNDKVAYFCALLLGNGKAGCKNLTSEESLPTMLMFSDDPEKKIKDFIGSDLKEFLDNNKPAIAECFKSFAYATFRERPVYDATLEAIKDPIKHQEFKLLHEDVNRTSMSRWVLGAWQYGEKFSK